jgi:hypothetical protein
LIVPEIRRLVCGLTFETLRAGVSILTEGADASTTIISTLVVAFLLVLPSLTVNQILCVLLIAATLAEIDTELSDEDNRDTRQGPEVDEALRIVLQDHW